MLTITTSSRTAQTSVATDLVRHAIKTAQQRPASRRPGFLSVLLRALSGVAA